MCESKCSLLQDTDMLSASSSEYTIMALLNKITQKEGEEGEGEKQQKYRVCLNRTLGLNTSGWHKEPKHYKEKRQHVLMYSYEQ